MVKRFLGTAIFGYFALFIVLTLLIGLRWNKERKAPEQPIAFSHEIHAGTLNLECLFCHESADKSYFGGRAFDYIAYLSRDPRFAVLWERYEAFAELAGFRFYRLRCVPAGC